MVAMEARPPPEEEERAVTRRTTRSMQAETGATMRTISSPRVSRTPGLELGFASAIGGGRGKGDAFGSREEQ